MAVITKKDEKIAATVEQLEGSRSPDDFVAKFKELYPKDWAKIEKSYRDHERKTKPGKSHLLPLEYWIGRRRPRPSILI